MPVFIVRVILHGAEEDSASYEDLHEKMEKEGYYRTVTASDGVKYQLPPATYRVSADGWTKAKILDEVGEIAASTDYKHSEFVTESAGCTWRGFKVVQ